MARDPLVELRDRLVARCALIVERHANATRVSRSDLIDPPMRRYVDPIIDRWLENAPPWRAPQVVGCTPDEIREVESAHPAVLPDTYREFLALMGREAADLDAGTVWLYPDVLRLEQSALDLLAEQKSPVALPERARVVAMDQGYQFWWFGSAEGSGPPVWYWQEGSPPPTEPRYAGWLDYLLERESYLRDPEFTRFEEA